MIENGLKEVNPSVNLADSFNFIKGLTCNDTDALAMSSSFYALSIICITTTITTGG